MLDTGLHASDLELVGLKAAGLEFKVWGGFGAWGFRGSAVRIPGLASLSRWGFFRLVPPSSSWVRRDEASSILSSWVQGLGFKDFVL